MILHELEATKGHFLCTEAKRKPRYNFWHRATILGSFWELLLRKKSFYDEISLCYDFEDALVWNLNLMRNRATIFSIVVRFWRD